MKKLFIYVGILLALCFTTITYAQRYGAIKVYIYNKYTAPIKANISEAGSCTSYVGPSEVAIGIHQFGTIKFCNELPKGEEYNDTSFKINITSDDGKNICHITITTTYTEGTSLAGGLFAYHKLYKPTRYKQDNKTPYTSTNFSGNCDSYKANEDNRNLSLHIDVKP